MKIQLGQRRLRLFFSALRVWSTAFGLLGLGVSSGLAGEKTVTLTTAMGNGADASTNANVETISEGLSDRLLIRRSNTKAYLRFDLSALKDEIPSGATITKATLRLRQAGSTFAAKPLEVYAVNLNYPFAEKERLGIDWKEDQICHSNAPAGGKGGSAKTDDRRSVLVGSMKQGDDLQIHSYAEQQPANPAPMLDYLNGISEYANDGTPLRLFIVTEAENGPNKTGKFISKDASGGDGPSLELTFTTP